jgi:hypothetical protein
VDFVKSVLDVLGGRVASDCAYAGVVVLLAKGLYPAEGERDVMKTSPFEHTCNASTPRQISPIGYVRLAASCCTSPAALHRMKQFSERRTEAFSFKRWEVMRFPTGSLQDQISIDWRSE